MTDDSSIRLDDGYSDDDASTVYSDDRERHPRKIHDLNITRGVHQPSSQDTGGGDCTGDKLVIPHHYSETTPLQPRQILQWTETASSKKHQPLLEIPNSIQSQRTTP